MSKETITELQKQASETAIWYQWFSDYREFCCTANQILLDEWLTKNLKPLSLESLDVAFEACRDRLARRTSTQQESTPVVTPAIEVDETKIPASITRQTIVKMDRSDFKHLLKKYGQTAVDTRLNGWEE